MIAPTLRRLACAFLVLLCGTLVFAGGGGPDAFGYSWIDSDSADLDFSWVEIRNRQGAGQVMGLADDNFTPPVPLGFDFKHYIQSYSSLRIGSNGWLSFAPQGSNTWCFQRFPSTAGTNSTLGPFMSDLNFSTSYPTFPNPGEVWTWSNPAQDSFIVSYYDVPWWKDDNAGQNPPDWVGANTFQVILTNTDSSITFQYLNVSQSDFVDRAACPADVSIGMENETGFIGLEVLADQVPSDSFAIKFFYPDQDTFQVLDARPEALLNPASRGRFVILGDSLDLQASIVNAGNTSLTQPVPFEASIRNIGLNPLWTVRDTLDSLPAGQAAAQAFRAPPVLTLPGQHYFEVRTSSAEDQISSNDRQRAELSAVDTTGPLILSYVTGNGTNTSLSWPVGMAGRFGGGTYMEWPYGRLAIHGIEAYIMGNDGDPNTPLPADFRLEILEADSNGMPGNVLSSALVLAQFALEDDWNYVPLPDTVLIDSGGFFVAWIQGGPGIGLGTEQAGPKARQGYELVDDLWATYRFNATEDLLLKVHGLTLLAGEQTEEVSTPQPNIVLYPNPATDQVSLAMEVHRPMAAQLRLLDLNGRTLTQAEFPRQQSFQHVWSVRDYPSGMYFIEIRIGEDTFLRKLVIE